MRRGWPCLCAAKPAWTLVPWACFVLVWSKCAWHCSRSCRERPQLTLTRVMVMKSAPSDGTTSSGAYPV
eukprot:scaffold37312_cov30-Tisochrysis_lutea.AAC.2